MRRASLYGAAVLALIDCAVAHAEPPRPLQPTPPASGASLQLYIKVRNQDLAEYCKTEQLGVPRCTPGKMYEAKDACPSPYKVAAVSCGLSDLGAKPRLVVSGSGPDQSTGACVWAFEKFPVEKAPQATTTLLCLK